MIFFIQQLKPFILLLASITVGWYNYFSDNLVFNHYNIIITLHLYHIIIIIFYFILLKQFIIYIVLYNEKIL
jgi:hypothetical protein